jgi:hypothetical protein
MTDTLKSYKEYISGGYPLGKPIIINKDGGPLVVAFFTDAELDPFYVSFDADPYGPFEVHSDGKWVSIDRSVLCEIEDMCDTSAELWKTLDPFWSGDEWINWDHLATAPNPDLEQTS